MISRALWMTAEVPDRSLSGGNIRQAHLLEALARRVPTDLVVMGSTQDPVSMVVASKVELPEVPLQSRASSRLFRRIEDLVRATAERRVGEVASSDARRDAFRGVMHTLAEHDVVLLDHPVMAPLVELRKGNRWLLTLQNLPSEQARQRIAIAPGRRQRWLFGRELAKARRFERWAVDTFDAVIVSSPEDAAVLGSGAIVIPNGVDTRRFQPTAVPEAKEVLLAANLAYLPNVDGALWFVSKVLPIIERHVPDVHLALAGRRPVSELLAAAARPTVSVHPDPADMAPFLRRCRVAVVPLRIGSGTRLKALEALASGRPVVGTTIGLAGLGLTSGSEALVGDDPETFASHVVACLTDDELAARLAVAGRALVEASFDWDAIGARFADVVTGT